MVAHKTGAVGIRQGVREAIENFELFCPRWVEMAEGR
jgi:hypothetical protein